MTNRPRSMHEHKYSEYKKCLSMMMLKCIKQHPSNIWSSIDEKAKHHWCWIEKKKHYLLKRKHVPLTMLSSRRKQNEKARKRWKYWARDLFVKQEIHGEYHHLLPDLLSGSRNFFYFRYRRMNPERLELLLSLVKGKISKGNMKFITSILPRERLVLRI